MEKELENLRAEMDQLFKTGEHESERGQILALKIDRLEKAIAAYAEHSRGAR